MYIRIDSVITFTHHYIYFRLIPLLQTSSKRISNHPRIIPLRSIQITTFIEIIIIYRSYRTNSPSLKNTHTRPARLLGILGIDCASTFICQILLRRSCFSPLDKFGKILVNQYDRRRFRNNDRRHIHC